MEPHSPNYNAKRTVREVHELQETLPAEAEQSSPLASLYKRVSQEAPVPLLGFCWYRTNPIKLM